MEKKFKDTSELLERERNLDTSDIWEMQQLFWSFHFLRKTGQEIEPFDPQRIKAHMELSGQKLSTWEYNILIEMDLVFRSIIINNRG